MFSKSPSSKTNSDHGEESSIDEGRFRNIKGHRQGSLRRSMCGEGAKLGEGLRHENPQQMGNAEESRNGLLQGGTRRASLRRSPMDHTFTLCISGN